MKKNFYKTIMENNSIKETKTKGYGYFDSFNMKDADEFVDNVLQTGGAQDYCTVGSAIKRKRLDLELTLGEVSKDICCLAYLSKLERNLIKNVNSKFVIKLCEKLDIEFNDLQSIKPEKAIEAILKSYLNDSVESINEIVSRLQKSIFIPSEELCRGFLRLLENDLKGFSNIMQAVDGVKNTLSMEEVVFMIFVMITYYRTTLQNTKAARYLEIIKRFEIKNKILLCLIQEADFLVSAQLSKEDYKYEYLKLKSYFEDIYPLPSQMKAKFMYLLMDPSLENLEKIENIPEEYVYTPCKEDYYYTYAFLLIHNYREFEGLEIIFNSEIRSPRFVALYGYGTLMLMRNGASKKLYKECYEIFKKMSKEIDNSVDEVIHLNFIDLMKIELDKNEDSFICDYIKYRFIDDLKIYQYMPYKNYIDSRYLYLAGKLSRYKDAFVYAVENENLLKKNTFYCIINDIKENKLIK